MIRTDNVERIFNLSRSLKTKLKAYVKKRDKLGSYGVGEISEKRRQSLTFDLNTAAHEIEVMEAELHAACVVAGVADRRSDEDYESRTWKPSPWHEYNWKPIDPKDLDAA